MPKVSVIVPVYKVEKYIERCARSLFEQTLDDIEYIFINDCTPDDSMKVLDDVQMDYPWRKSQIRIINLKENKGAAYAREIGIKTATGDYIIHCDSDDFVDIKMYEILYNKAHDNNIDIMICDFFQNNENGYYVPHQNIDSDKDNFLKDIISKTVSCGLWNKLVKKDIFSENEIFYPKYHMMEDLLLCVQMIYYAKNIDSINLPLYYYCTNESSVSNMKSETASLNRLRQSSENILLTTYFLRKNGMLSKYRQEVVRLKYISRLYVWDLLLMNPDKYYNLWKETFPELNRQLLFCKYVSWNLKIIFYLTLLHIYPYKQNGNN